MNNYNNYNNSDSVTRLGGWVDVTKLYVPQREMMENFQNFDHIEISPSPIMMIS